MRRWEFEDYMTVGPLVVLIACLVAYPYLPQTIGPEVSEENLASTEAYERWRAEEGKPCTDKGGIPIYSGAWNKLSNCIFPPTLNGEKP